MTTPHDTLLDHPAYGTHARMAGELFELPKHFRTALTGPHRTGKTSMAKAYGALTETPYYSGSATELLREGGIDSSATYSDNFGVRLKAQRYYLDRLDCIWDGIRGGFVTDRSPLCLATYTLADITGATTMTPDEHKEVIQYVNDCKALTLKHFNTLVLVPMNPAIELVPAPGKGAASPAFIHHFFMLTHHLFNTLDRREDADPSCDDLGGSHHPVELRYSVGTELRGQQRQVDKQGFEAQAMYSCFAEESVGELVKAILPHSVKTIDDRARWLLRLNQRQLHQWLAKALEECADSPALEPMLQG